MELLVAKPGRHFAVLGMMLELGSQSILFHKQVAQWTVDLGLDGLVIVANGPEAEEMAIVASTLPRLSVVSCPEKAFNSFSNWLKPGDVVLV